MSAADAGEKSAMTAVLLVEDDARIGALLTDRLQRQELAVSWARSLTEGWRALENPFDLALVDLALPDGDGLDLLGEVRVRHLDAVVVILTAHGDEVDVLVGLDAGADDYRLGA